MELGPSLGLIAIGAIFTFALPQHVLGINLGVIGLILMVVGAIGLAVTLLVWGPRARRGPVDPDLVEERRVVDRRGRY